jgi:small basic protein
VRPEIAGILVGSSIKGMLVGVLSGWYARKVQSTTKGIMVGSALGLLFAGIVAGLQGNHYLEILLPGFVVGAIIGFLTQRMGTPATVARK